MSGPRGQSLTLDTYGTMSGEIGRVLVTAGAPPVLYSDGSSDPDWPNTPPSGSIERVSATDPWGMHLRRFIALDEISANWMILLDFDSGSQFTGAYWTEGAGSRKSLYLHDGRDPLEITPDRLSVLNSGDPRWMGHRASSPVDEWLGRIREEDRILMILADSGQNWPESPRGARAQSEGETPPDPVRGADLLLRSVCSTISGWMPDLAACEIHDGRFDLEEIKRWAVNTPSIRVAVLGVSSVGDSGDERSEPVYTLAAMVITRNAPGLPRGKAARAITDHLLREIPRARWGLTGVGDARRLRAQNLYSGKLDKQGVALWGVLWEQKLRLDGPAEPDCPLPSELYVSQSPETGPDHISSYRRVQEPA